MIFTTQTIQEILPLLQTTLKNKQSIDFQVLNPDIAKSYAGTKIILKGDTYVYRGYKSWIDLAELLRCRMLTPKETAYPLVKLTFQKLASDSFHTDTQRTQEEKYGISSAFSQIHKMEEPAFFYYYNQALSNVKIENKRRILNLGINTADEFTVIKKRLDSTDYADKIFIGIDHSKSVIDYAKSLYPEDNVNFYAEDINHIDKLKLGRFDLLISIGTLQSPSINFKPFLMSLVQNYLQKDAAIILGFPNSRWIGGEMIYGAKAPNYAMSEMSLLFNDIIFAKKYLQQKKFRVTITGKHYLFLTATKIDIDT